MRTYQQFCPAARALDVVGERWSLLVVRELLFGPKRYTDLQDGLPGVGPNVLAERLRSLQAAGLIDKRRLPPPAASTVYELTELGEALRPVLQSLFAFGLRLTDAPGPNDTVKASYWLLPVQTSARPEALGTDIDDTYEFRIDDEVLTVRVAAGRTSVQVGAADSPDLTVSTDHSTFAELGMGRLTAKDATAQGRLSVQGDADAAARCAALFALGAEQTRVAAGVG